MICTDSYCKLRRLYERFCLSNVSPTPFEGDLSEKTKENNEQREEIIRLKQENGYLSNELMLTGE